MATSTAVTGCDRTFKAAVKAEDPPGGLRSLFRHPDYVGLIHDSTCCATAAMPRVEPSGAHDGDGDCSTSAAMHRVTAPLPLAPLDAVLLVAGVFPTSPRVVDATGR